MVKKLPLFFLIIGIVFSAHLPMFSISFRRSPSIITAVKSGDIDTVKQLVEKGAHVNAKDLLSPTRKTALMLAVEKGDLPMAQFLIEKGADVNASNWLGQTPLIIAADTGNIEMARLLLDNGATQLQRTDDLRGHTATQRTALMHAVARNNMPMVQLLLQRGADPTTRVGTTTETERQVLGVVEGKPISPQVLIQAAFFTISALDLAVVLGNLQMIKLLLEAGDYTPLAFNIAFMYALKANNVELARFFLNKGADVNYSLIVGGLFLRPVDLVIRKNNPELMRLFLEYNVRLEGILFNALLIGSFKVARVLYERGHGSRLSRSLFRIFDNVSAKKEDVSLLLRYALKRVKREPVTEQETAEMRAASKRTGIAVAKVVALLAALHASRKAYTFAKVETLHSAAARGSEAMVRALIARGDDIDSFDRNQRTPLMYAAAKGHTNVARLLIEKGASVSGLVPGFTASPLTLASSHGHKDVVELLITKGADVNGVDSFGMTPLMRAAGNGHFEIVKLLIEKGANAHAKDNQGMTAYHYASTPALGNAIKWHTTQRPLEEGASDPESPVYGLPPEMIEEISKKAFE